jgi:hypothetical protein
MRFECGISRRWSDVCGDVGTLPEKEVLCRRRVSCCAPSALLGESHAWTAAAAAAPAPGHRLLPPVPLPARPNERPPPAPASPTTLGVDMLRERSRLKKRPADEPAACASILRFVSAEWGSAGRSSRAELDGWSAPVITRALPVGVGSR